LLFAFPLAYKLARTQSRYKNLMIMLLVLPLFVGNAVRAAGWMTLFGNRGFVNVTLQWIGITSEPITLMYTEFAVIVGILAVNLPYVVLTLQSVLEGIDRALEDAAFNPFGAAVSFILMTATLILTATANLMVQRRYRYLT
jgi:putative spermidine/putrescine transport system permease protein